MAGISRFAFLYEYEGERNEYSTAGENLSAEAAVARAYAALPDGTTVVKALRGDVPDDLDLSPPEGVTSEAEGDDADLDEADQEANEALDEWHNWNEDDWLDLGYQQRSDDVANGLVDPHLDDIEDAETSSTVEEAVAARREELEAEQ